MVHRQYGRGGDALDQVATLPIVQRDQDTQHPGAAEVDDHRVDAVEAFADGVELGDVERVAGDVDPRRAFVRGVQVEDRAHDRRQEAVEADGPVPGGHRGQ